MTFFRLRLSIFHLFIFFLGCTLSLQAEIMPETSYGGFLGVETNDISANKAKYLGFDNQYGAYLSYVFPNSPASRAGLRIFDYIIEVENKELKKSYRLSDALSKYGPGDAIDIAYIRNGIIKETNLVLVRRSDVGTPPVVGASEDAFLGIEESSYYNYDRKKGVRVNIVNGSSARDMGLRNGDVIFSIDGYRMLDWEDIKALMNSKRAGERIDVVYYREGSKYKTDGMLKSRADRRNSVVVAQRNAVSRKVVLGVISGGMTTSKAKNMGLDNPHGFYIKSVTPKSTADKYGLMPMDYIYGIDSYRVGSNQSLGNILSKYEPGEKADIHIIRQGKAKVIPVVMENRSSVIATTGIRNACEKPFLGVREASNKVAFGLDVTIVNGSPAEQLGLQDYDAITKINGHYIIDWNDLSYLHSIYQPGDDMVIEVFRSGDKKTFKGKFISKKEAKNCETCTCGEIVISEDIAIEFKELEEELEKLSEELRDLDIDIDVDIDFGSDNEIRRERGTDRVEKRNNRSVEIQKTLSEEDRNNARSFFGKGDDSPVLNVQEFSLKPLNDNVFYGIHFKLLGKGFLNVKVASESGRLIYDFESSDFEGIFEDRIDLAQKEDTYYFFIRHNGKEFVSKVVLK